MNLIVDIFYVKILQSLRFNKNFAVKCLVR